MCYLPIVLIGTCQMLLARFISKVIMFKMFSVYVTVTPTQRCQFCDLQKIYNNNCKITCCKIRRRIWILLLWHTMH